MKNDKNNVQITRTQGKFNASKLLCHNHVARRKEKKKFTLWTTFLFFLLLNEDIKLLLKFRKKFYKYLFTYMLHSELRKRKDWCERNKFFVLQLSVSYVQNEKKWLHALQARNSNKRGGLLISSRWVGKKIKKLTSLSPVFCQSKQVYKVLNLHDCYFKFSGKKETAQLVC